MQHRAVSKGEGRLQMGKRGHFVRRHFGDCHSAESVLPPIGSEPGPVACTPGLCQPRQTPAYSISRSHSSTHLLHGCGGCDDDARGGCGVRHGHAPRDVHGGDYRGNAHGDVHGCGGAYVRGYRS
jgi:hypothetical protein